jgi:hypothetical protein
MDDHQRLAFFSANLYQYLPGLPWSGHPDLYQQYQSFHRPRPIPRKSRARLSGLHPKLRPGILAAFHLGDHTLLPVCLANAGVPLDILIDGETYAQYAAVLEQAGIRHGNAVEGPVKFLFSEDPRLFFRMREGLRRGRHLLFFVDGNRGWAHAGGNPGDPHLLAVPFFSGRLHVKRGVAVLARLLNVPIYPILGNGDWDHPVFGVPEPIRTNPALDRAEDARQVLGRLFGLLEARIRLDPMHWECWSYLHMNGMLQMPGEAAHLVNPDHLEAEYMANLTVHGRSYWLDKRTYIMYFI